MNTATRSKRKLITIGFSPEQMATLDAYRAEKLWTKSRIFEEALREYFNRQGRIWPVNEGRIA